MGEAVAFGGMPFQSVTHLEEGTMPAQGDARSLFVEKTQVNSLHSLADWVDSWSGPLTIGELSSQVKKVIFLYQVVRWEVVR